MRGDENLVKVANSSIPSHILFLDARRYDPCGGHIHYLEFENTTVSATMQIASTYTRIKGDVTFLTTEEDVDYQWGEVEREYPVVVRYENGEATTNAEVNLFDPEYNLVWRGTTDQEGRALFNITFTENNWERRWELRVTASGVSVSKEVKFLSSTPIVLTISKPTEVFGFPIVWIIATIVVVVATVGFLMVKR
jgi:hypothetical protein